jgi:hypothetical protein
MATISVRHDDFQTNGTHSLERLMSTVSQWRTFTQDDGTTVNCLIAGSYLELVVIEDEEGNSLDIPPDMVDVAAIEKALNLSLKLH